MAPKGTRAAGVQPLIESAQRRLKGLQRELHASTANIGRKNRELQRLELARLVITPQPDEPSASGGQPWRLGARFVRWVRLYHPAMHRGVGFVALALTWPTNKPRAGPAETAADGATTCFGRIATSPPGVCSTRSIGVSGGVSLIAAMVVWASRGRCAARPRSQRGYASPGDGSW